MKSKSVAPHHDRLQTGLHHAVTDRLVDGPYPEGYNEAVFAMGCFWGVEQLFWKIPGVWVTFVGYTGGKLASPDYEQVCTGETGHAESVKLVFDPQKLSYTDLLSLFWENHNPTQGMRQGADTGSQYRSAIFFMNEDQEKQAKVSKLAYQKALHAAGHKDPITTEIKPAGLFYPAEDDHQQYLAKNPDGYCGLKGTGVSCAG